MRCTGGAFFTPLLETLQDLFLACVKVRRTTGGESTAHALAPAGPTHSIVSGFGWLDAQENLRLAERLAMKQRKVSAKRLSVARRLTATVMQQHQVGFEAFYKFFNTTWYGGMSLMNNRDFNATLDAFELKVVPKSLLHPFVQTTRR